MRCRLMISLILSGVAIFFSPLSQARDPLLKVDETRTIVRWQDDRAKVSLALRNSASRLLTAEIALELVDPEGRVRASTDTNSTIAAGGSVIAFEFPHFDIPEPTRSRLVWYRLRYRLALAERSGAHEEASAGIISLSEIMPDLFELRFAGANHVLPGGRYRASVYTLHPITSRAVAGVRISARIEFDAQPARQPLKVETSTNAEGYAALEFTAPPKLEDIDAELSIEASRDIFTEKVSQTIRVRRHTEIVISTDKPLYQPGQSLHVRALVFDGEQKAMQGITASCKIDDPEGKTVFRDSRNTSRFGHLDLDWQIPESARSGDYSIQVWLGEYSPQTLISMRMIRITRYEMPTFSVSTKADRTYYLPRQNAEIEVRGDYLFGQSLTRGRVRLVREGSRSWDAKQQQWEVEDEEIYTGELDNAGRALARIDLTEAHEDLSDNDHRRFEDLKYTAYITDATTGRTESKRFDLRVTKDEIHLYLVHQGEDVSPDLQGEFYLTASFADGAPAECEVDIDIGSDNDAILPLTKRKVRTNRYGVAKVTGVRYRGDGDDEVVIKLRARDDRGRGGEHEETLGLTKRLTLHIATTKTIHRPGAPIEVRVTASRVKTVIVVDLTRDSQVLDSRRVNLVDGGAQVIWPYREAFRGELIITAYAPFDEEASEYRYASASRGILYPRGRELSVELKPERATYRPGDEASAEINLRTWDGRPMPGIIGAVVYDRAIDERARTEREFGSHLDSGFDIQWNDTSQIAGLTRRALDRIDRTQSLPAGLDLVAEVLLSGDAYQPSVVNSERITRNLRLLFYSAIQEQVSPIEKALGEKYDRSGVYPQEMAMLSRILLAAGIDFARLRDPWGTPYRSTFLPISDRDVLRINCAGTDKRFDTDDDFVALEKGWHYFRSAGESISRAVSRYHARTGRFIRDLATLNAELRNDGIDFGTLRDRWGAPYRIDFSPNRNRYVIKVISGGPDRSFSKENAWPNDDVILWTAEIDFFTEMRARIAAALDDYHEQQHGIPHDEAELHKVLVMTGIDVDSLVDLWNRRLYANFKFDKPQLPQILTEIPKGGVGAAPLVQATPPSIVKEMGIITLASLGADGMKGTADDFEVATFWQMLLENELQADGKTLKLTRLNSTNRTGAIVGMVVDSVGASIPNARVRVFSAGESALAETRTGAEGLYLIRSLPSGVYRLRVESPGFIVTTIEGVLVHPNRATHLKVELRIGAMTETVTVSAAQVEMITTQSSSSSLVEVKSNLLDGTSIAPMATPRLREYFPETLLWRPAIETDQQGRVQLKFRLADSMTTWRLAVIGSTEDGRIGEAETEVRAFQPFFIEHDPPRTLTVGDEISLPIVVRNYLDRAQTVETELTPGSWFSIRGQSQQRIEVGANDSARVIYDVTAHTPIRGGKQRVDARNTEVADAVERTIEVRPDGEAIIESTSAFINERGQLEYQIPAEAIAGTARAELKIYPNLRAHVLESIEAIMQQPHGCGEQTISSTYPSLLALRFYRGDGGESAPLAAKARRYLIAGYNRLCGYQTSDGGFGYWQGTESNLSLTAYALKFLHAAREFINVDEEVIEAARNWLIEQQRPDGSWASDRDDKEDSARQVMTTAYIARVLTAIETEDKDEKAAFARMLAYLGRETERFNDPYLIAQYALAAQKAGQTREAARARERLKPLAHEEGGTSYWTMESMTPFNGWGLAGRIESTAVAVQALAAGADRALVGRGLSYLLSHQDRYGVWHSTPATVNVLDALIASEKQGDAIATPRGPAEIWVNGKRSTTIDLPSSAVLSGPLAVDLSPFLTSGRQKIEIKRATSSTPALAQLVTSHFRPWPKDDQFELHPLRLDVRFAKTTAAIGEEIACTIEAGRNGMRYGGMLIAEIGLPPGAEVDRASLEAAKDASRWMINHYEIQPDRVVFYLWPRAEMARFTFKFRPRYGLRAVSAPSILYDYYNPEARESRAPVRFEVR